jgi:WD40-like Beta Propeller Repeat
MFALRFAVRSRVVLIVTVFLALLMGEAAWAQKNRGTTPPPPPAPGTIYFRGWVPTSPNDGYYTLMRMNGDGTNKSAVAGTVYRSYQQHGGSHWSLAVEPDYDNPQYNLELFAYSGSGPGVQLTSAPTVYVADAIVGSLSWGRDDSFVSYSGWWYTGPNMYDVQGGLFVVPIDWSTGVPTAGTPQLIFEAKAYLFQNSTLWYPEWTANVNILNHDWAANSVVFEKESDQESPAGIYVAGVSSGPALIRPLVGGYAPQWSPNGSRIAYTTYGQEIWTIHPDGTNPLRITQATSTKVQGSPTWSPDGTFMAYTEMITAKGKMTRSVMRKDLANGSIVNLTSNLLNSISPTWR